MVHAQAIEQMILGEFLVRPDWAIGLERALVLLAGAMLLILLPRFGASGGAILCLAMIAGVLAGSWRSEEQTSELQSLMRISHAGSCVKKKTSDTYLTTGQHHVPTPDTK